MSDSPASSRRVRKVFIWCAIGTVAAATAGLAALIFCGGEDRQVMMLSMFRQEEVPNTVVKLTVNGVVGEREVASVREQAPGLISEVVVRSLPSGHLPDASGGHDMTVTSLWLQLSAEERGVSNRTRLRNWISQKTTGHPAVPGHRIISQSDVLHVRVTPQGKYYLSTAEDREHMVHPAPFEDGPGVAGHVADAMLTHWSDWVASADMLVNLIRMISLTGLHS